MANQEWSAKSPPSAVSTQLTTPNWVSNSHWNSTVAVIGGTAQASTRATDRSTRTPPLIAWRSRAMARPSAIVAATLTTVKAAVRATTVQKKPSVRTAR